jgi:hypothetical protein
MLNCDPSVESGVEGGVQGCGFAVLVGLGCQIGAGGSEGCVAGQDVLLHCFREICAGWCGEAQGG